MYKMEIKVEFSHDGLFGDTSLENVNVATSRVIFMDTLVQALKAAYPRAGITVEYTIHDRHMVDGLEDHEEAPWVGQIINDVWQDFGWLREKGG